MKEGPRSNQEIRVPQVQLIDAEGHNHGVVATSEAMAMAEEAGSATVLAPSGETFNIPLAETGPGTFAGSVEVEEIGLYQIGHGTLTTLAHVGPVNAPEFEGTVSTTEILDPVAEATGGIVRRIETGLTGNLQIPNVVPVRPGAETAGRDWMGLRQTDDSVLRSVSRVPLFAGFFGLALLLMAIGSMWWREGR